MADKIVQSVPGLFGAPGAALFQLQPDGYMHAVGIAGDIGPLFRRGLILPPGTGVAGAAVRERRPVVTSDVLEERRADYPLKIREALAARNFRAMLSVPVIVRDGVIGAISIVDRTGRQFDAADVRLAEALAAQAGVALVNAQLYESSESARRQAENHARNLKTLSELTGVLASASAGERVFEAVAVATAELFGAMRARVWVADMDAGLLRVRGEHRAAPDHQSASAVATLPFGLGVVGTIFTSGKPEYIVDVQEEPRWSNRDVARAIGARSFVGVPLVAGERRLGVLSLFFSERRSWSAEEQELLELLGNHGAIAIANAELLRAREERAVRMRALARLNQLVSSSLDAGSVLTMIANTAVDLVGAPFVLFWVLDPVRRVLEVGASSPGPAADDFGQPTYDLSEGLSGWIATHGRPLEVPDLFADERFLARDWALRHGFQRFYGLPLRLDDRLLGVLAILSPASFRFTADDRELLDAFAGQAAVALGNARLYREARESSDRLRALEQVNRLISSSLEVEEVLGNVAGAVARFFEAPFVSVWSHEPATGRLRRALVSGDRSFASSIHQSIAVGEGAVGWAVQHREATSWIDVMHDSRVFDIDQLLARGLRYLAAYPIAIGERVLGAFAVARPTPPAMTPETDSLIRSLAAQAAVALDHARLYAETAHRLDQTAALLEVSEILGSTLDAKQLLKRVAIKIAQVTHVDRCSIELWDGDRVIPLMSQFADGRHAAGMWETFRTRQPYAPREVPAHAKAIETRRAVVIDDTTGTDLIPLDWIEDYGLRSFMVVPLVRQDAVVGMLSLDYTDRTQAFAAWQVDLAMAIAGPLALSIDNTRLYDEVRERLREASTLLTVGELLSERAPQQDTIRQIAREVGRAVGADMVGAYLLDDHGRLVPFAGYHVPAELREHFTSRPLRFDQFPLLAATWSSGRAQWSSDAHADAGFDAEWLRPLPPHSVLFAPAIAHGTPRGALFFVWWRPGRYFADAEIRLIEAVGRQVGLALENAELARQTEAKLRETETLLSVADALGSTLDLSGLLRHLLRQVQGILGADSVGMWAVAADGDTLEPLYGYRVPVDKRETTLRLRPSTTRDAFYAAAARTRKPVVSYDAMNDPGIPAEVKAVVPHRSQLFVPVVVNERMVAAIAAVWFERPRDVSASELALLEAVASHAGVAMENARLFSENVRQVAQLSVLHELSRAITGQLDRAAVLDALYRHIARVLDVRNMVVLTYDQIDDAMDMLLRVRDGALDPTLPRRFDMRTGLAAAVIHLGRSIRTDDYVGECVRHGVEPQLDAVPVRHWLGVPMHAGGRVIGAIGLRSAERAFTADDERLLANIADLGGLALRTAYLFDERARAYRDLAAAQDQLVRTEKLRALGEMASGVAHDFNNLLAAILGRAQLVLHRLTDPKLREWVGVIERAAIDGAQTVRRLQEFTRIRRDEPLVAVDLNQVVKDALEITQSRWREEALSRGVTIDVQTALGAVPEIAGDPPELREALTNLILNAVDAMPDGGTLTLETADVAEGVRLVIRDTGIGMPEAVRNRIFDPFFTTKGPRGTGLGLSITYGILSRHGATVTVESAEGRGTTFGLVFPRGDRALTAQLVPAAPRVTTTVSLACLVVDDDEAVGSVVGDMIVASGHSALVLDDPVAGIERASHEAFDVVFTDLAMPRLSGWDVARAVKARTPEVPVFMMTGFGVELTEDERLRHGLEAVLVKPLRIDDIQAALARVTERRAARPAMGDSV